GARSRKNGRTFSGERHASTRSTLREEKMTITLNRRQMLAALGATTALAGMPFSAFAQTQAVRIGTSSVGSVFYTLAIGAGEIIGEYAGINTTVEPVGGSAANIN